MATVGYTLMTEQAGPADLVRWAARAEQTGFGLLVSSDHYFPWVDEMGHAPNAWVTLGAVAQATERAELMTYVTCPTMRYHPAVVAQQAATLGLLSEDRFTLGLGAGESLNEHVAVSAWPNAELPGTSAFAAASQFVRPEDVAGSIPCGDSAEAVVKAASAYWAAGFTDLALVQIGGPSPSRTGSSRPHRT
jgi:alkanesulfonate monooxygenase SsuD/methylene tetrahydromethanopterin reductase-like flavin-dependent oxidoreductase (luciferase family)